MKEERKKLSRLAILLSLGLGLLVFDFLSKAYVFHVLAVQAWGGYLNLPIFHFLGIDFSIGFAMNKGAAWGLFANFQFLLIIVRILVLGGLLWYLFFLNRRRQAEIPLVLVIAGALGNIIDFFLYGFVIDFLHFNFWGYDFPVFNFADSAITIGVIWLFCIASFKKKIPEKQP